jgi:thiamine-monophosphate kinase
MAEDPGVDEFELIRRLFLPLAGGRAEALGLEDDVALIEGPAGEQWVVSTDAIVAGVHFFADDAPDLIARKLIRVNLSDLAAKSATPRFALLTSCLPRDVSAAWLQGFAAGLSADCATFHLAIIGGDTVATPGPLTLSLTAIGTVPQGAALLRSTARSGDSIWVSGSLGDAALGLRLLKGEGGPDMLPAPDADWLIDRYHLPQPRLALGRRLRGVAHAAMDISDGLLADLGHLCEASGVSAQLDAARLPLSPAARAALAGGLPNGLASIVAGGDDYELLFTAPGAAAAGLGRIAADLTLALTCIGSIGSGRGVRLVDQQGAPIILSSAGYRHFSGLDAWGDP